MEFNEIDDTGIIMINADGIIINNAEDGTDLIGNIYYEGYDKIIIHENGLTPDFFDLKNGIAGEILQKFSNYRVQLAIVGDFTKYTSKSIKDFIYESNKTGRINFVASIEDARNVLAK